VEVLEEPLEAEGEEFIVSEIRHLRTRWTESTVLEGEFVGAVRGFPTGTYFVDMAQPMANAAFYYLEPQSADGFVGWGVMKEALQAAEVRDGSKVYPVFKLRRPVR
jgi:hypothetical protein